MRTCPVCNVKPLDDETSICADCSQRHYKTCNYLATYLDDVEAIATRKVSTNSHSLTSGAAPSVQFPIRIKAWETVQAVKAHVDNVIMFNHITVSGSYAAKLKVLAVANVFESATFAIDLRGFVYYAKEVQQLLTPPVEKTYIGSCPRCRTILWATVDDETITCPRCKDELSRVDVKARLLKSLYNSTYTSTISELVAWLKTLGIKTSKRSIQRWCSEGRIHAQNADGRGTKVFKIGDVLKLIKMAQSS